MHVESLSDLPESWLEKEFVERDKKKAFGVWCSGCWDTLGQEERMRHP